MALESATYIDDLVTTNPVGGSDPKSQGDDHIRLLKTVLKNTFPGLTAAVNFGGWHLKVAGTESKTASSVSQLAAEDGEFIYFDTSSNAITYSLLAAATAEDGFTQVLLKDSSANLLTVTPAGSENLNGANSSIQLGPNEALILGCDGSGWFAVHVKDGDPGDIQLSGAIAVPTGWLDCDGTAISRTTYARLFAKICITQNGTTTSGSPIITGLSDTSEMKAGMDVSGSGIPASAQIDSVDSASQITLDMNATASATVAVTVAPFGVGDGSTTFNVPNMKSRAPIGSGQASGLTERRLGVKVGAETHQLTEDEMPAHVHKSRGRKNTDYDKAGIGSGINPDDSPEQYDTTSTGGDQAHENMQPSLALKARIKF